MSARDLFKAVLPVSARQWLRRQPLNAAGALSGDAGASLLRRTIPYGEGWGGSRGTIIDRYYIEAFLREHAADIRGSALDFGDDAYARKFGGNNVTKIDVLNVVPSPQATIVADLTDAGLIPSDSFDCILCTQVLLLIYDLHEAVRTLYRILKPGGILLVTVPGIQKISRGDMETCGDFWRFTSRSLRRIFEEAFPTDGVEVTAFGNVLAAVAFLHGLAAEDLHAGDLDRHDPDFEVTIGLRGVKPIEKRG
jgi:SAM-dependent methyltransferase